MLFNLSLSILACYYLIAFLLIVLPIKAAKNSIFFIWVCYVISLSIIGYYIVPSPSLDLYRIYEDIDNLRLGITTIFDSPFFLNNLIYWIVSKTDYNGWYAFISMMLIGGLELSIIKEYSSRYKINTKAAALYFFGCNANAFIVYLFIGRSFLVAALYVYAFYVWKEKKKKIFWLLALACCFIHSLGVVLLLLTLIYEFTKGKKTKRISVLMIVAIFIIAYLLSTDLPERILGIFNLDYFSFLQDMYQSYSLRGIEFQQGREMLFRTLNMLYMLICILYLWHKGNNRHMVWGFFIMITFVSFNFSIIFERMPYVIGVASFPVLNDVFSISKGIMKKSIVMIGALVLISQTIWGIYEAWLWLDFSI